MVGNVAVTVVAFDKALVTATTDVPGDIDGVTLNTDDRSLLLRAERSDTGRGRTYTLTYRATDRAGNSVERQVTVVVPHDQR